jgi:hypothetical protein
MATNVQSDVHSKRFALRLATMINARLIWYKHYYPWADQLIAELDTPPTWLLEIATIKYYPDAVAAINGFVYSEPFESFDGDQCADEHVACLFLRYQSGATSWATFLNDAGSFTDGNGGRRECEYFYAFLNELEDNEYARAVEARQRSTIESEFSSAVSTIRPLYDTFMNYFRQYVQNEAEPTDEREPE